MNKKAFGIIFPIFFMLVSIRSIEQINWLSYLVPVFYFYFLFVGFKEIKNKELKLFLVILVSFSLWAMITSFWSPYPLQSFIRASVFLVSSCCITLAGYYWINNYSKNGFVYLLPLNILLLTASFFSLMFKLPSDYWSGYGFGLKSFWSHQNVLASLIIFTLPGLLVMPFKTKKIKIISTLILFSLNIYVLLLTHSRTSATVLLLAILLYIVLSKNFKILWIIILIITSVTAVYLINKDFHSLLHDYIFKTEISFLDRKKPILSATYEASGHGGWKGLGYGVSDSTVEKNLQLNVHYHYEGVRIVREKGISVLALLEETGWVGLVLFLLFVGYLFYVLILTYLKTMDRNSIILICVLFGMCLHAQLEGWWLGVGSVQLPLFMGVAGVIIGNIRIKSAKNS
ncbi:MAG: hypothetical protein P4L35_15855 [Ignavibacteriaceae bacterium]|nr:hypothetical protein [Ignavibacteriaceae bacterium]